MHLLTFLLIFATIFTFIYIAFSFFHKEKLAIKSRLGRISRKAKMNHYDEELSQPLFKRVLKPIVDDISKGLLKITPNQIINNFEKKIIMAGTPYNFTIKEWTNMIVGIVIVLPLVTILIGFVNGSEVIKIFLVVIFEIITGIALPNLILTKKMQERKSDIIKNLPDIIDLLTVSVEAGLGFDGALAKVVEKAPGQASKEFTRVLQEMKMGKPKKDALKEMSNRIGISDMTTFIGAIIQADQLGVSIGNVLRIQSEQMRQKRRQRAQEKAMKAPIKMLLPMVFFIFPTIFTVLIGPAVIKMIGVFMK